MNITFPSNTKTVIDAIRGVLGRGVEFITTESGNPCPVCDLDPIANTSTDSFCETCSGMYWIPVYETYTISGHITWGQADILDWQSAGQLFDGECRVQVEYTDTNITILDKTEYLVVDNKKMEVKKRIERGVPTLNRVLLDLIELDKEA